MLVRLEPGQIAAQWEDIKQTVRRGLPPTAVNDDDRLYNILTASLSGRAQVWEILQEKKRAAILVTMILHEEMTKSNTLIIYSFAGITSILQREWAAGMETLKAFALANDCEKFGFYTTLEPLVETILRKVPGATRQTYVDIPVDEAVNE